MTTTRIIVLAAVLGSLVGCNNIPSDQRIALGRHYLQFQRWQEAADEVKPVVEANPGDWRAQFVYGRALANLGDLSGARRALDRAYDSQPMDLEVIFALADVEYRQQDFTTLYQLLRGVGRQLHSGAAYVTLAEYAEKTGDLDTAQEALRAAIEVDDGFSRPRSSDPYYRLAVLDFKAGRTDEGTRRLRQAYGVSPTDPRVRSLMNEHGIADVPASVLPPGP